MMGRPVTIPAKPARIVSINPTATEMLYIAGGTTVARGSSSTFPSEVLDLPELGGAYSPSFEAIAAQRADLILIEALSQARFPEPLMQFGAPVVAVRATSLDDITTGIKLMGQIIEAAALGNAASNARLGSVCLWRISLPLVGCFLISRRYRQTEPARQGRPDRSTSSNAVNPSEFSGSRQLLRLTNFCDISPLS